MTKKELASQIKAENVIVSAVCHGQGEKKEWLTELRGRKFS
jgi:hypothetical protein